MIFCCGQLLRFMNFLLTPWNDIFPGVLLILDSLRRYLMKQRERKSTLFLTIFFCLKVFERIINAYRLAVTKAAVWPQECARGRRLLIGSRGALRPAQLLSKQKCEKMATKYKPYFNSKLKVFFNRISSFFCKNKHIETL